MSSAYKISTSSSISPSPQETFDTLCSLLSNPALHPLEIEILPRSHPTILHDGPSLGIPKHLLLLTYPLARGILLAHTTTSTSSKNAPQSPFRPVSTDLLTATLLLLLLLNPEHVTAANARKRLLLSSLSAPVPDTNRLALVKDELAISTTLLTSPLPRHAKSPTLWSHRHWLVRSQWRLLTSYSSADAVLGESGRSDLEGREAAFVKEEMGVVLRAAEKKMGNYHAFMYARRVVEMSSEDVIGKDVVERIKGWCLAHPRDVSAWAFLAFLLTRQGVISVVGGEELVRNVREAVEEFVQRVGWEGESIAGFLRAVSDHPATGDEANSTVHGQRLHETVVSEKHGNFDHYELSASRRL